MEVRTSIGRDGAGYPSVCCRFVRSDFGLARLPPKRVSALREQGLCGFARQSLRRFEDRFGGLQSFGENKAASKCCIDEVALTVRLAHYTLQR